MDQRRYRTVVEWSPEDKAFVARVPALNAMGHGDTAEDAVHEAGIGAEGILAVMRDEARRTPRRSPRGRAKPTPRRKARTG